jgi:hypothetical protein
MSSTELAIEYPASIVRLIPPPRWIQRRPNVITPSQLKRVHVGNHVLDFLLIYLVAKARHHASSLDNGLSYMSVRGGKAAGQIRLAVKTFQARSLVAMSGVRRMAIEAVHGVHLAAAGLLRVQSEFRVRQRRWIFSAASGHQRGASHNNQQKQGSQGMTISHGMTIMSLARPFAKSLQPPFLSHAGNDQTSV